MLFGVGLLLMTERSARSGRAAQLPDIYLRRNLRLCVFGLLHGALIWLGDILPGYRPSQALSELRFSLQSGSFLKNKSELAPFLQER